MKPIASLSAAAASRIDYVLTDIDDTMTEDGRLHPDAFVSLWKLRKAGVRVIPVTGRPAGWCDMIIRQWPVEAVVGENGAFVFYQDNGILRQFFHPSVAGSDVRKRLDEIRLDVLSALPGTRIAKDQFSRLYDLAIDFREEPPFLDLSTAERIKEICEKHGAQAKISSIHVNTWFGDYDKLSMSLLFLQSQYAFRPEEDKDRVFYCGDSPNDEPMFAYFPNACAVANILPFLPMVNHEPSFVTEQGHGPGFAEAVDVLLRKREKQI